MSPLRVRMIEDMTLAGLASGTQELYVQAVRRLAAHYRRSPDELTEELGDRRLVDSRANDVAGDSAAVRAIKPPIRSEAQAIRH